MGRERINAVTTSFFGRGSIGLLPGELKKRGYRRGLIVTDRFLFEHKAADRVGEQDVYKRQILYEGAAVSAGQKSLALQLF